MSIGQSLEVHESRPTRGDMGSLIELVDPGVGEGTFSVALAQGGIAILFDLRVQ